MEIPRALPSQLMKVPANRLEVLVKFPYTERMKNKNEEWYRTTNRHEKVEYLKETTNPGWFDEHFIQELVTWMGEDSFNEFFKNQLVRYWEIKPEPELNALMSID